MSWREVALEGEKILKILTLTMVNDDGDDYQERAGERGETGYYRCGDGSERRLIGGVRC